LEAASGYDYDAGSGEMAFAPQITPDGFRAPFFVRDGWGTFAQQHVDATQTWTLHVAWGEVSLQSLGFQAKDAGTSKAQIDGVPLNITTMHANGQLRVVPAERLTLRAGQRLEISMSGTDTKGA
jgi:hypothetical protein